MELLKQVCSYEQAKKLKQLGIAQNRFFSWTDAITYNKSGDISGRVPVLVRPNSGEHDFSNITEVPDSCRDAYQFWDWDNDYSAYTVAELGIMLPPFFPSFVHDGHNHSHCRNERVDTFPLIDSGQEHEITPAHKLNKEMIPISTGTTEAQSRAAMLIFLLENGIVTAEEVNQRLS